jgi:RNA polymerase sigma factor (sigma-70 family)
MHSPDQSGDDGLVHNPNFPPTRWSKVLLASRDGSPEAHGALERLCQRYWYPLYAYLRSVGHDREEAEDLVQGFFAELIDKNFLRRAEPLKGRFRTFLLLILNRFRANEWDKANRQKRGGGASVISLDGEAAEAQFLIEPVDDVTPEKAFDRAWARMVLGRVLDRLEQELAEARKKPLFEALKVFLTGDKSEESSADIARKLGMSDGSVRVAIYRLRRRYGELLREEIAETVSSPQAVDDEIQALLEALS